MQAYSSLFSILNQAIDQQQVSLGKAKPQEMYKPMSYILGLGGKRVRPLLTLVGCDLFDADPKEAIHAALSVELFHNFSLIHDDILDKAPLRRGKATVHVKWGTNIAILSGDAMLVESLKILQNYPAKQFKELSQLFNATASEVCEGQQIDMNFENQNKVSPDEYIHMIELKTAVLLGCSLKMGAINAGAAKKDQDLLYNFGKNIGIAFQLVDDYLDAFADKKNNFGKRIGGDILANKKTFLLLELKQLANQKQKKQIAALQALGPKFNQKKITGFLTLYKETRADLLCLEAADYYTKSAINSLEKVKASPTKKELLKQFAIHLINRQS